MLYELAITPQVFSQEAPNSHHVEELLRELSTNGMLANLNSGGWISHVDEQLKSWPEDAQFSASQVRAYLKHLADLHRIVVRPSQRQGTVDTESHWLDIACASHQECELDWIVATRDAVTRPVQGVVCKSPNELRASVEWRDRPFSATVRMREREYRDILKRVVRHARRIELVDPYLSLNRRNFRIVEVCTAVLRDFSRISTTRQIHLHTWVKSEYMSCEEAVADLDAWAARLDDLKRQSNVNFQFRVFLWRREPNGARMHDRFLLTDQCGFMVGNGFDCGDGLETQTTTWTLLDEATWRTRREELVEGRSPYLLLGDRTV